jgi:hypothetical protein
VSAPIEIISEHLDEIEEWINANLLDPRYQRDGYRINVELCNDEDRILWKMRWEGELRGRDDLFVYGDVTTNLVNLLMAAQISKLIVSAGELSRNLSGFHYATKRPRSSAPAMKFGKGHNPHARITTMQRSSRKMGR